MRVLDLFAGCGGLSFGLEMTGHFVAVCGLDLLPDRLDTFLANHPCAAGLIGDIRDWRIEDIRKSMGRVDLIAGGPPCQGFSSIRPFRAVTEGDRRNNLIEYFVLIIAALKPKWMLLENVVGMLTHKRGVMLESVISALQDIGYNMSWRIINAALYGVPQNRERIVIIGNRMGIDFKWPEPTHFAEYRSMAGSRPEVISVLPVFSPNLMPAVTVSVAISDLAPVEAGEQVNHYIDEPRNDFQRTMRGGNPQLTLHRATRHTKRMLNIIEHAGANISHIPKELISSGFSTCYSRLDASKPSTTLTVNFVHPASNRCIHPRQNRALTIREGARLQSFPDRFEFIGTTGQIVKQIGNAVPPLLAKALGEAIYTADDSRVNQ
ncbi:MAG TPA: DNA cytosine methyltransferase [bacterium]|nr:DNA cytosine methyltransferase [bacterium]